MPEVKLLNGWIRVRPDPDKTESSGGLVMPSGSMEEVLKWGTVVSVGGGQLTKKGVEVPVDVKTGDRVCYIFAHEKASTNKQVSHDFDGDVFLREKDIVAVQDADQR